MTTKIPGPNDPPVARTTWQEFMGTGLMWWINRALHVFGWAIVVEVMEADGSVVDVYPARVTYLGFPAEAEDRGFMRVRTWMEQNAAELRAHAQEAQNGPPPPG